MNIKTLLILFILIFSFELQRASSQTDQSLISNGLNYLYNADYNNAVLQFNEFLNKYPNDAIVLTYRAIAYEGMGDFEKSGSDYSKAIQINPQYSDAYMSYGYLLMKQEIYEKSEWAFSKAIEFKRYDISAYLGRCRLYMVTEDYVKALADLNTALNLDPRYYELYLMKSTIYFIQNDTADGLISLNDAIDNFNPSDNYDNKSLAKRYDRSVLPMLFERYVKKIEEYTLQIQSDSMNYLPYLKRGVNYLLIAKGDAAKKDFLKVEEINNARNTFLTEIINKLFKIIKYE